MGRVNSIRLGWQSRIYSHLWETAMASSKADAAVAKLTAEAKAKAAELICRVIDVTEGDTISNSPGKVLERLYQMLSTLDAKASSLLRLNAIAFGVVALVVKFHGSSECPVLNAIKVSTVIGLVLITISSACCYRVIRVKWDFLEYIKLAGVTVDPDEVYFRKDAAKKEVSGQLRDLWLAAHAEMLCLADVVIFRSKVYKWAWWMSWVGCVFFAIVLVWSVMQ